MTNLGSWLHGMVCVCVCVSNTWFAKKDRLKHTWQHPRTKQWHCIDYIVTSQRARRRCRDAQVISTAECGSDHALLGMRFDLGFLKRRSRPSSSQRSKPFNVDRLRETRAETHPESVTVAESFQNHLRESLQDRPPEELSLSEKWSVLRECIVTSAEEKIGRCQRVQPDWYRDSSSILTPLLEQRNKSYADWVAHGRNNDHYYHQFKSARRVARRAVRRAQTSWFEEVAAGAESARFDGARMWKKIRILQRACRGLEPVKVNTIKDESGTVCATPAAQAERWNRHFERVLNIPSELNYSMLEALPQREVQDDLGDRPTLEEVRKAIGQLDNGKAAGASQIIAELMKAGGSVFTNALLVLLDSVWEEERVPQDWVDSVLVPIPKKGDLSSCDNWRGIALLDVVGKAVARLVQTRLQVLAEQVLPESQCGFRRQRSCTDMIFSVRQLQEKVIEHKTQGFFVFVDLKKAYDSVPRSGLWLVLARLGVPPKLVNIIRAFHEHMSTQVRVDGSLLDSIPVKNGLRQGCCMAPVLFNLYMCAVVECWHAKLGHAEGVGIDLCFRNDGKLLRNARQRGTSLNLTEGQFADDAVLFTVTRPGMETAITTFIDVAAEFGLTVSLPKTNFMAVGAGITEADRAPVIIGDSAIEHVSSFRYLGSHVDETGRSSFDIDKRIAAACRAFGALREPVFKNHQLSIRTKRLIFSACVLSVLLYGGECWVPLQQDLRRLSTFYHGCIRSVLGIRKSDIRALHFSTNDLLSMWGDERPMSTILLQRRLEWLGHVARMPEDRIPKALLFSLLDQRRPPGGPRKRWRDSVRCDLKSLNALSGWYEAAQSRSTWRELYLPQPNFQRHFPSSTAVCCRLCRREFSRPSDFKRHKCLAERLLPVHEQSGAVQCPRCGVWFRSAGGLAVHTCRVSAMPSASPATQDSRDTLECSTCGRSFKSASGLKRHKCVRPTRASAMDRADFLFQCACGRRFRREQDIKRHRRFCRTP